MIPMIDHHPILRSVDTTSGMSMLRGDEIASVNDLPGHLVEVHVFSNDYAAASFVTGLKTAGLGNAADFSWEPGSLISNRIVFIARFDEPRPLAEAPMSALRIIRHSPPGLDGQSIAASTKASIAARMEADRRSREEREPLISFLRSVGVQPGRAGDGWLGLEIDEERGNVQWKRGGGDGPWRLEVSCSDIIGTSTGLDVEAFLKEAADGEFFVYDRDERSFVLDGILEMRAIADHARSMQGAMRRVEERRRQAYEERFRSGVKMTASRRRFLVNAEELGIRVYDNRRNLRMRAGGEDIGATEIGVLRRIGWITDGKDGVVVTDTGRQAIGMEMSVAPSASAP